MSLVVLHIFEVCKVSGLLSFHRGWPSAVLLLSEHVRIQAEVTETAYMCESAIESIRYN
jgi:hypothetical protein